MNTLRVASVVIMTGAALFSLSSCYDDDSSEGKGVNNIAISGINLDGYTVTSYAGKYLDINPEVKSMYSDDDLKFEWLAYSQKDDSNYHDGLYEQGIETDVHEFIKLGTEKNLHCEINLSPDLYVVVLRVTSPDGVQNYVETKLQTVTNLSEGYYILKETADGNTEVDHYDAVNDELGQNLLAAVDGEAMSGKPVNISTAFNHSYTGEDGTFVSSNIISVTTHNGGWKCYSTKDFSTIFDRTNMLYAGNMESDEVPYGFCQGMISIYFLTSKGIRSQYDASVMGAGSGMYGLPGGDGGSRFYAGCSYATVFWNEAAESFYYSDYNGTTSPTMNDYPGYKCLDCGRTDFGDVYFILENGSGKRKVVSFNTGFMGAMLTMDKDIPADSHMAKATDYSVCYSGASYIYCLDGNKVYTYDAMTGEETEVKFTGIASGDNITYVSCNYGCDMMGMPVNMYLIVGTQNGQNYTLRFYSTLGGKPDGEPAFTVNGTGVVKAVRYTSLSVSAASDQD